MDAVHANKELRSPAILCVRRSEPSWVALTVGFTGAGFEPPRMCWASTGKEAACRLREEAIDCLIVDISPLQGLRGHDEGGFPLIRGIRGSGFEQAIVIVAPLLSDPQWMEACNLDCDPFVSSRGWEAPALAPVIERAISRAVLATENRQLQSARRRQLQRESDEAEQLLNHQRQMIADLESLASLSTEASVEPADVFKRRGQSNPLSDFYEKQLKSYMLADATSPGGEVAMLADRLAEARMTASEALAMHVRCVEKVVAGRGSASARHVVARADRLAIELLTRLADRPASDASPSTGVIAPTTGVRKISSVGGVDLANLDARPR